MKNIFTIIICWLAGAWIIPAYAQSNIVINGSTITLNYSGTSEDYLIPTNSASGSIIFKLRGGDGGEVTRCGGKGAGGKGAVIDVAFNIGNGMDELEPGGTLRFVVGQKGKKQNNGGGGGGGGTAILYKSPTAIIPDGADTPSLDMTDKDTSWILLAVAGGGGGAYTRRSDQNGECLTDVTKNGNGANTGTSGTGGGGNNDGGDDGNGGEFGAAGNDGGGGGGYLTDGQVISSNDDNEFRKGRRGGLMGNFENTSNCDDCGLGGNGYGSGGDGVDGNNGGGGGGGGFSGGGGGNDGNASANNGGGAGSFINSISINSLTDIDGGGNTNNPNDGKIEYTVASSNVIVGGGLIAVDYNGTYQDFIIPADLDLDITNAITLVLRGGDGGIAKFAADNESNKKRKGGGGATLFANFKVGNDVNDLKPGGTLRFIVGQQGGRARADNRLGFGAGGGGGTAVLYLPPGISPTISEATINFTDDTWRILAVAGGGGGAWVMRNNNGVDGSSGRETSFGANGGNGGSPGLGGQGGQNGFPGTKQTNNYGSGGGYLSYAATIPELEGVLMQGDAGIFTGGAGGSGSGNRVRGGYGYGGGGSGRFDDVNNDDGAGGGGGFSGGGGGNMDAGGGGGSWVNPVALDFIIERGQTDGSPDDGIANYQFFKTGDNTGGILAPIAQCKSVIVTLIGDEAVLTPDMANNNSFDPNDPAQDLTFKVCREINNATACLDQITIDCDDLEEPKTYTLEVSNDTRTSKCTFIVEGELGENTFTCPESVTVNTSNCLNIISEGDIADGVNNFVRFEPPISAACDDSLSYFIIRPDQSIDHFHEWDNFDRGIIADTFDFGTSTIVYNSLYTNEEGDPGIQNCSFTLTLNPVVDEDALNCPSNIFVDLNQGESCSTIISDGASYDLTPNYTGEGDLSWQVTSADASPNITHGEGFLSSFDFEIGINTVEYFAKCDDNVIGSCSFLVVVNQGPLGDNDPPQISCVSSSSSNPVLLSVYDDIAPNDPFIINQLLSSATDDCFIASYEIPGFVISCSNLGNKRQVTIRAFDAEGLNDECLVWVKTVDDVGISCLEDFAVPVAPGSCEVPYDDIVEDPITRYLCHISFDVTVDQIIDGQLQDVTPSNPNNATYETGLYQVNITNFDNAGNSSSCSHQVTVQDTEPPEAACTNITIDYASPPTDLADLIGVNSTDNCGSLSYSIEPLVLDCNNLGWQTALLTVSDEAGNTDVCSAAIQVLDLTPPVINSCPTDQNILVDSGPGFNCEAFLPDLSEQLDAFDDCTDILVEQFPEEGTVLSVGQMQVVELTIADENGNETETTCTLTLTVVDDSAPIISCSDVTVQLDVGTNTADVDPEVTGALSSVTDDCNLISEVTFDGPTTVDCSHVGTYTQNIQVTDISNNIATCSVTVTVEDETAPLAICQNVTIQLNANGQHIFSAADMLAGGSDNCPGGSVPGGTINFESAMPSAVDCSNTTAPVTVTVTINDGNGNTASCEAIVTVTDDTPPFIDCRPITVDLDANGQGNILASDLNDNNGSSDACGLLGFSFDEAGLESTLSVGCQDIGTFDDLVYVTDVNGNVSDPCPVSITVRDVTAPDVQCKDVSINLDASGAGQLGVNGIDNGTTDNCPGGPVPGGIVSTSWTPMTFDCSDVGTVSVTQTFTDASGNSASCTQTVTVNDATLPVALCNNTNVQLDASGNASITVDDIDGGATDACGLDFRTLSQSLFTCADVGTQSITLTVTDPSGNSSSCNATVTVEDNIAPIALCKNINLPLNNIGQASVTAADIDNGSNDNCPLAPSIVNPSTFDCSNVGINSVQLTVTDINGNTATCTSTVTVIDDIAPSVLCQDIEVLLDANGQGTALVDDAFDTHSYDACGPLIISFALGSIQSSLAFDCSHVGNNTATVYAIDANGNVSDPCPVSITVRDVTAPNVQCKDVTVYLSDPVLDAIDLDNGSTDECTPTEDLQFFMYDNTGPLGEGITFDCADVGTLSINLLAADGTNSDLCTSTITVIDDIAPIALCQNLTVTIDADDLTPSITPQQIDNGSSDACGIEQLTLSQSIFDCDDEGANPVTLTVEDVNGNQSSCNAIVTVTIDDAFPNVWSSSDIGMVSIGNDYAYEPCGVNSGQFYITGSGNNAISNTTDNVAFASQSLCGNGSIIAKVESIDPNGYGGLMIRETIDAGSKQAALFSNMSSILRHEVRYTTNGVKQINSFFKPSPIWLKLERQGDWVFSYYSTTGGSFQYVHGVFVPMQSCVEIGLASFTNFPFAQTEAIFNNVTVSGSNGSMAAEIPTPETKPTKPSSPPLNLLVYPNPVSDELIVQLSSPFEEQKTIVLYNTFGQQVATRILMDGQQTLTWDLNTLPTGTYWIKLDKENLIQKVVVSH